MTDFENLYDEAKRFFDIFIDEFKSYGIDVDPNIELRRAPSMESYYSLKDGHVYVSVLDVSTPSGKISKMFLRSLLSCETDEELYEFLRMFNARVIAHELAHHLRHRYNLFDPHNLWNEEQIANQLALAVTKHRLAADEQERAKALLKRAIDGLSAKMESEEIATVSYHDVVSALNTMGKITESDADKIQIIQKLFSIRPEEILKGSGQLSDSMILRLNKRENIIDSINEQYTSNLIKYMYYHLGWLYCDLTSSETQYVDEFIRNHLNQIVNLLPPIHDKAYVDEWEIQACYKAAQQVKAASSVAYQYFYKRYRSLLISKMKLVGLKKSVTQVDQLHSQLTTLMEKWQEGESDPLNYLASIAPPRLRKIFPNMIAESLEDEVVTPDNLPTETDKRIWRHIISHEEDTAVVETLHRLTFLEGTEIYGSLPAEVLIELAYMLYRVKLLPNERIIREGEKNDDVYILIDGELVVSINQDDRSKFITTLKAGDIFGEIAFFTDAPRVATVRATVASECFALKASDMYILSYKHPSILMQMGRTLAKRLAAQNTEVGVAEPSYLESTIFSLTELRRQFGEES